MFLLCLITTITYTVECNGKTDSMVNVSQLEDQSLNKELKELKSVYSVAKNISYSKGAIIKSKDGEFEYRRSFISKVDIEVNSLQLQGIIDSIRNNSLKTKSNKYLCLNSLDILESLVHQYDIGKKFVQLEGFKYVISLTRSEDHDIVNKAFMILSAAMQGNPDVQKYALTTNMLKCITTTLHQPLSVTISSALYALSTFIRNCPECLDSFMKEKGLNTLSMLLIKYFDVAKIRLKIINILEDITVDLYGNNIIEDSSTLVKLQQVFYEDIQLYSFCDIITDTFYASKEYTAHEKIVATLNTMFEICKDTFKNRQLIHDVKTLIKYYDPFQLAKDWYTLVVDLELRYYLFQDLTQLYNKMASSEILNKNLKMKSEL